MFYYLLTLFVKDINLVTTQQYLVFVCAWVHEKGQTGQIYNKIKSEICLSF